MLPKSVVRESMLADWIVMVSIILNVNSIIDSPLLKPCFLLGWDSWTILVLSRPQLLNEGKGLENGYEHWRCRANAP